MLLVPTVCEGKGTDAGENFALGAGTVELRSTPAPLAPNDQVKMMSGRPSPFMSAAKTGDGR